MVGHTTPNNFLYILEGVRVSTSSVFYDIRDPPVCRFHRAQNNRFEVVSAGCRMLEAGCPPFGPPGAVRGRAFALAKALSCWFHLRKEIFLESDLDADQVLQLRTQPCISRHWFGGQGVRTHLRIFQILGGGASVTSKVS